jgi:hypothetical protein
MEPKLLRLAYIAEFLLALIAVFIVWSQVGGQTHLDLMAWYFKLFFSVAIAYAVVRATQAAVGSEDAWNGHVLGWLALVGVLAAGAGMITYYVHLYEPADEEDQPTTQTSIVPTKSTRAVF